MVPAFRLLLPVARFRFALHADSASPALRLRLLTGAAETLSGGAFAPAALNRIAERLALPPASPLVLTMR